ncbi:(2Fe-2S)-binding protein (plasmid) [Pseudanabaena biceps]|nr:(2Fe-2S)-binding protein [Pseudanabaena biceps]
MYVCICHAITEKDIQKAVNNGACSIIKLSELTMLGTQCGSCTRYANQVLNQCASKSA